MCKLLGTERWKEQAEQAMQQDMSREYFPEPQ